MKLIILILIRTVLISAGIPTLFLLAVLFAWALLLFMSLHQLRGLLQTQMNAIEHLNIRDLMLTAYKSFDAINLVGNAIHAPSILQIKNK